MRGIFLAAAALLAAGCLGQPTFVAPVAVDAAPPDDQSGRPSFSSVTWFPTDPRSGQSVLVRALVSGGSFPQAPSCHAEVGPAGRSGGGASFSGPMRETEPGVYECVVTPTTANDFVAVLLIGHDGTSWVRSELEVVRTPDGPAAGRPPSRIADLAHEIGEDGVTLAVHLENPVGAVNAFTTAVVATHRLPRDHHAYFGLGLRAEPVAPDRLEATHPLAYPEGERPTDAGRDPDFVLLASAFTYNEFDGLDVSGLVEIGHGACAARACIRS